MDMAMLGPVIDYFRDPKSVGWKKVKIKTLRWSNSKGFSGPHAERPVLGCASTDALSDDRRDPHRATSVSADRPGCHASGDGDTRARRRAAWRAMRAWIPWVPRRPKVLVGAPAAVRELDGVGLAEIDHARRHQLTHQRGLVRRDPVVLGGGATHCNFAFDLNEVLDRDRDTVEGPNSMTGAPCPRPLLQAGRWQR